MRRCDPAPALTERVTQTGERIAESLQREFRGAMRVEPLSVLLSLQALQDRQAGIHGFRKTCAAPGIQIDAALRAQSSAGFNAERLHGYFKRQMIAHELAQIDLIIQIRVAVMLARIELVILFQNLLRGGLVIGNNFGGDPMLEDLKATAARKLNRRANHASHAHFSRRFKDPAVEVNEIIEIKVIAGKLEVGWPILKLILGIAFGQFRNINTHDPEPVTTPSQAGEPPRREFNVPTNSALRVGRWDRG